jgi:hypothetical protein
MTSFTRRTAALLACSFTVVLMTACGSGSDSEPAEGVASGSAAAAPAAAAPSDSLLPEGTYRTLELTREQLLAAAKKAGLTRPHAEQALAFGGIKQPRPSPSSWKAGSLPSSKAQTAGLRESVPGERTRWLTRTRSSPPRSAAVRRPSGTSSSGTRFASVGSRPTSTPIDKGARATPSAQWPSLSGRAHRSAGPRCSAAAGRPSVKLNVRGARGRGGEHRRVPLDVRG